MALRGYHGSRVNNPRPFDLVIFDCDGVLVDSEVITNRVFATMLAEQGLPVTLEFLFDKFVGRSMRYCLDLIAELLGRPVPPDFMDQYRERTSAALHAELNAVNGIEEVLDRLDAEGVPFCVASSGSHGKMRTTLGITGLLPRFEGRLHSVTEVAHSKPAPDVYLYAASKMGFAPARCYVVEDTLPGAQAGVAAGMTVFGYCGYTPVEQLRAAGAQHTFDDMAKLPDLWFGASPPTR